MSILIPQWFRQLLWRNPEQEHGDFPSVSSERLFGKLRVKGSALLLSGAFLMDGFIGGVRAETTPLSFLHLFPIAGQQGTTTSVHAPGKFDPWPAQVWVDTPGIVFKATDKAGKFDVEIAPDAVPGAHLVRLFSAKGSVGLGFFIVSPEPEVLEVEPNDQVKASQVIRQLPVTVSGRLDKAGDVDGFAVTLRAGEILKANADAYVLGSTFDGLLRIVDSAGTQLAFNHDGNTLDPSLTWQAPQDGTFIIQLMGFVYPATSAVALTGGDGCVYRLHLSLAGAPTKPELPADGTTVLEQEPNDRPEAAQAVAMPSVILGKIEKRADEDRFAFVGVKGRVYDFSLKPTDADSPLDGWIRIEDLLGKKLAFNDDADQSANPKLKWTAPNDGKFLVAVGDIAHHGGELFGYRLTLAEAAAVVPSVEATLANHAISVTSGQSSEVKMTVKRLEGFKGKLQIEAKGLPEGVTLSPSDVPEKPDELPLKFTALPDAAPSNVPVRLILRETETGAEHDVLFPLIGTSLVKLVPQGYSELVLHSTNQLWLTVPPRVEKAPEKTPPAPQP
jgi:hypothetical protein